MIDIFRYNGELTIYNPATGGHKTIKIKTATKGKWEGCRFISVFEGSDNTDWRAYRGIGQIKADSYVKAKWDASLDDRRLLNIITHPEKFPQLEFKMATRCRVCNRKLTNPVSIDTGIGPECSKR